MSIQTSDQELLQTSLGSAGISGDGGSPNNLNISGSLNITGDLGSNDGANWEIFDSTGAVVFAGGNFTVDEYGNTNISECLIVEGNNGNAVGLQTYAGLQVGIAGNGFPSSFDNGLINTDGYGILNIDDSGIQLGNGEGGGSAYFSNGIVTIDSSGNIRANNIIGQSFYYPNNALFIDSYDNLYYSTGQLLADNSGNLYAPNYFNIAGDAPSMTMFNTNGASLKFRVNQKDNNEGTVSWNVDGDNGDAIDDGTQAAYKLSFTNDNWNLQAMQAGDNDWGSGFQVLNYTPETDIFWVHGKLAAGAYQITEGTGLYYPSGNIMADQNGKFYFNNGTAFSDGMGNLYYTNGSQMSDIFGELYVNGIPIIDSLGQIYYGNTENRLTDAEARLYYGNGATMTDTTVSPSVLYYPAESSGAGTILADSNYTIRYGFGATLSDYNGNLYYSGGDEGGNTYLADSYDSLYGGDGNILFDNTTSPVQFNYPGLGSEHPLANAYGALFRGGNGGGQYIIDDYDNLYLSITGGGIYDANSSLGSQDSTQALISGPTGVVWGTVSATINAGSFPVDFEEPQAIFTAGMQPIISVDYYGSPQLTSLETEITFGFDEYGGLEYNGNTIIDPTGDFSTLGGYNATVSLSQNAFTSPGFSVDNSGNVIVLSLNDSNGNNFESLFNGGGGNVSYAQNAGSAGNASSANTDPYGNPLFGLSGYVNDNHLVTFDQDISGFVDSNVSCDTSGNIGCNSIYIAENLNVNGYINYSNSSTLTDTSNNLWYSNGLILADSAGHLYLQSHTPASSTATGNVGELVFDSDYIYICTATNVWKRTSLASW